MKENIKDYAEQLKQLCEACKKSNKCKDHNNICLLKKFAWNLAKAKLRHEKEGTK